LFFPFSQTGGAKVFKLKGKSNPPEAPEQEINISLKARETKTQVLMIKNWLKQRQSLMCSYTLAEEDDSIFVSYGK